MEVNADAMITAIFAALGGFLLKYIWDSLVNEKKKEQEKAQKYDKQELQETVEKIVKDMCLEFKGGLEGSINEFKTKANTEFDRYSKMYWEAVEDLHNVEKDFHYLRQQDLAFYKYQLINSCKKYISQGYITQYQFDRLSELHKIYHDLGGNSQGDLYFQRATTLPLAPDNQYKPIDEADDELYVTEADMKDLHIKPTKKEEEQR